MGVFDSLKYLRKPHKIAGCLHELPLILPLVFCIGNKDFLCGIGKKTDALLLQNSHKALDLIEGLFNLNYAPKSQILN